MKPLIYDTLNWVREKTLTHQVPPFIILGAARSGSTWLRSLLDSHHHVYCHRELLSFLDQVPEFPTEYFYDRDALVQMLLSHRYENSIKTAGFKLLYDHDGDVTKHRGYIEKYKNVASLSWRQRLGNILDRVENHMSAEDFKQSVDRAWNRLAENSALKIIHLIRRNELRRYISYHLALYTDRWTGSKFRPTPKACLTLDVDDFLAHQKETEALREEKLSLFKSQKILTVYYEDLLDHYEETLLNIFEFLGVPPYELSSIHLQQRPEPMQALVKNYEAFKDRLKGTEAETFLDD